eukprot:TRINITY_DN10787_c0_g1_i1.p1 TRINITY_DN10787_c0_g1~~TRINITY_DN10787_c0_g1_i1.p1  ORF type:complete len:257 (+),score=37.05 TRINITY_DN10787_c0_g1_i1:66-773(+)
MAEFLVTGATGYVGSWCVKTLLDAGHTVTGTVRDPESAKCDFLYKLDGAEKRLTLVKADLLAGEEAWRDVVKGAKYVLHTASPFVIENVPPGKEEEVILKPAVDGTTSVIKACLAEKVQKVVLTSSVIAIAGGHHPENPKYSKPGASEEHWTDLESLNLPQDMYAKSKVDAERAAWALVEGSAMELAVVNPALVLGPFLSTDTMSGSLVILRALLNREYPMVPQIPFEVCDVFVA